MRQERRHHEKKVFLAAKASNLGRAAHENVTLIRARRGGSTSRGRATGEDSHTLTMVTLSGADWAGVPVHEAEPAVLRMCVTGPACPYIRLSRQIRLCDWAGVPVREAGPGGGASLDSCLGVALGGDLLDHV